MGREDIFQHSIQPYGTTARAAHRHSEAEQLIREYLCIFSHAAIMARAGPESKAVLPNSPLQQAKAPQQNRFLSMDAVFRFIENDRLGAFEHFLAHLFSDMCRQAV